MNPSFYSIYFVFLGYYFCMAVITLVTEINAPIERCFDLARSIDLHSYSTAQTQEKAIAGVTSGLIQLNETVTWEAIHFGVRQRLTSRITQMEFPVYFVDEQVKGIFRSIYHQHKFEEKEGKVWMTDIFEFKSPLGILGKIANVLFLKKYLTRFILRRNNIIKHCAETELWKQFLAH